MTRRPPVNFTDITGHSFGRLVVISRGPNDRKGNSTWNCKCGCGAEKTISKASLVGGKTKSCGCMKLNWMEAGLAAKHRVFDSYKRGANRRGLLFELNFEDFVSLCERQCKYCGNPPSQVAKGATGGNGEWLRNGIDRIDSGKGYLLENCGPCCWICNLMKNSLSADEFYRHLEKILAFRDAK